MIMLRATSLPSWPVARFGAVLRGLAVFVLSGLAFLALAATTTLSMPPTSTPGVPLVYSVSPSGRSRLPRDLGIELGLDVGIPCVYLGALRH